MTDRFCELFAIGLSYADIAEDLGITMLEVQRMYRRLWRAGKMTHLHDKRRKALDLDKPAPEIEVYYENGQRITRYEARYAKGCNHARSVGIQTFLRGAGL